MNENMRTIQEKFKGVIVQSQRYFTRGSFPSNASVVNILTRSADTGSWEVSNLNKLISLGRPATFGVGAIDTFDENYRKGKFLMTEEFQSTFEVNTLIPQIKDMLFPNGKDSISLERYRLNIYQEGGHFNAHKDTPRSENFVGSLVVCLPYEFTCGEFYISHKNSREKLDWAELSGTHIQWVAFYGDCYHWIEPVLSGTRVTLTYNIFLSEFIYENVTLKNTFNNLLNQYSRLVNNKNVVKGISTSHQYVSLKSRLKGTDAVVFEVLKERGLKPYLGTVLYEDDDEYSVYGLVFDLEIDDLKESTLREILRDEGYHRIRNIKFLMPPEIDIANVGHVIAYGNSATLSHVYQNLVILFGDKIEDEVNDSDYDSNRSDDNNAYDVAAPASVDDNPDETVVDNVAAVVNDKDADADNDDD